MSGEVFRHVAFPFEDGRFPPNLGAVVQRTVLTGQEPARVVIHDGDNDWLVGDGVNDPNGASVVACISHVADADPAVAALAALPVGYIAERDEPHLPWTISVHAWPDE
ncbi:hypothetical protein GKC29_12155 [Micromonospora sp. WMMC415]|uniref:hypothetical protein n=1 Tax=Micromonospora sp. WMMC415 TaxID=2675222 RepID=UPI0012B50469|nr:hypothetical protein [Micromonospora sp. WMMC415]QGN47519.1 hypothetical protein GKC29_12155 [Micromonospora sp. WMMC415]